MSFGGPDSFFHFVEKRFCAHGAVADLLARVLSGDDGDLRAVVEMAVEELRSLSCARADVVLKVADVLAREDGPFNVCVASAIKSGNSTLV